MLTSLVSEVTQELVSGDVCKIGEVSVVVGSISETIKCIRTNKIHKTLFYNNRYSKRMFYYYFIG